MFNFLKKQKTGTETKIKIAGMHCSSCALSIDNALEDVPGVLESATNYAKGETVVRVDESVNMDAIAEQISQLGYTVETAKK